MSSHLARLPLTARRHARRLAPLLATLAAAAIAACSDGPNEPRGLPLAWPLEVGARWTYSVQYVSTVEGLIFDEEREVRVVRDTVAYGRRWLRVEGMDMVTSLLGRYFAAGKDGIVVAGSLAPSPILPDRVPGVLTYPAPGVRGDYRFYGTRRLTRPDSTVTVPAGTFDCLRYRGGTPPDSLEVECVAPGVGLVAARRLASYLVDSGTLEPTGDSTFYVVRLKSYSLSP
jgi:hypothetical protein